MQVSPEVAQQAGDADLIVLEGMGRGIETNLYAQFSVDSLKLGMIKHREVLILQYTLRMSICKPGLCCCPSIMIAAYICGSGRIPAAMNLTRAKHRRLTYDAGGYLAWWAAV